MFVKPKCKNPLGMSLGTISYFWCSNYSSTSMTTVYLLWLVCGKCFAYLQLVWCVHKVDGFHAQKITFLGSQDFIGIWHQFSNAETMVC